jgi:hypothetical protein
MKNKACRRSIGLLGIALAVVSGCGGDETGIIATSSGTGSSTSGAGGTSASTTGTGATGGTSASTGTGGTGGTSASTGTGGAGGTSSASTGTGGAGGTSTVSSTGSGSDPCMPNPCQNGGTCTANMTTYTCTCVGGYTGMNCEVPPGPAEYCDVLYAIASGNCGSESETGRFHTIKTGFGALNTYFNTGKNCTMPKRGTGNGTNVASPFTPAAFPRGYLRLRFPSNGGMPAAGTVQLVEYYLPIEFTVTASGTTVVSDVDHSAGLLQYANAGCPAGYTGCVTGVSDTMAPVLNRPCTSVASGTLAGTTLTWGTCGITAPPPCLGTGCTATTAQLDWLGTSSQTDTSANTGCLANVNSWGGVWCQSGLGCGFVPGTGTPSNDTWDQKLPNLTFSSTNYNAAGTTVTLTEFIVPDDANDVYSGTEVITATYVSTECGTPAQLTCNEQ